MQNYKFGFIGCGNMGQAIIRGILEQNIVGANEIIACDIAFETKQFCAELGIAYCSSQQELALLSEMIFLCVKPNIIPIVAKQIDAAVGDKPVVSIAAAWGVNALRRAFKGARILRLIPNTPLLVGVGCTAFCDDHDFSERELRIVKRIFECVGVTHVVPEKLFDSAMALTSCGCVYAYMLIESMADAGVRYGLGRKQAVEMAAQAILGGAKMALDSGKHTAALKDEVCSPGGVTIEAVAALEKHGYRNAVIEAVGASIQKSADMQKSDGK